MTAPWSRATLVPMSADEARADAVPRGYRTFGVPRPALGHADHGGLAHVVAGCGTADLPAIEARLTNGAAALRDITGRTAWLGEKTARALTGHDGVQCSPGDVETGKAADRSGVVDEHVEAAQLAARALHTCPRGRSAFVTSAAARAPSAPGTTSFAVRSALSGSARPRRRSAPRRASSSAWRGRCPAAARDDGDATAELAAFETTHGHGVYRARASGPLARCMLDAR